MTEMNTVPEDREAVVAELAADMSLEELVVEHQTVRKEIEELTVDLRAKHEWLECVSEAMGIKRTILTALPH